MTKATEKKILTGLKTARKERRELREDLDNLAIITKTSFDRVDERFDTLEKNQERLERGMKAILEVVQENNILLKEFRTHPDRIARLERSAFGSK